MSTCDRQAVHTALQRQFGRAITVTEEMINSVLEGLREDEETGL